MKNFLIIAALLITTFAFAQVQVQVIRPDSVAREGQVAEVITGNIDSMLTNTAPDSGFVSSNVNVFMDARLEALNKRPAQLARARANAARKRAASKKARNSYASRSSSSRSKSSSSKKYAGNSTAGPGVVNYKAKSVGKGKTKKTVTGSIVTKKGYRIVIYTGNSRQKAIVSKQKFMRRYSSVRSYMTYNRPYYKIRVGNFASKGSANSFRNKIKGSFPSAFVVPDIVTVKNIRVR